MAVTLEQISTLMDEKLESLREKITKDIENKFLGRIEVNERNIAGNTTTLEGHTKTLEHLKTEHDNKVKELEAALRKQTDELDDLTNRSMRGNVVVRGLEEADNEDWDATKHKLCEYLSSITDEPPQQIFQKIDRAHRSGKIDRDGGKPRNIYANFTKSVEADYYIEKCIKHNIKQSTLHRGPINQVRLDHQFTKKVEERRNLAKIERRKLLDAKTIVKGHLVYPAKLLIKTDLQQKKWHLHKEF